MNNILLFDYIKRFTERVLAIAASGYSSAISGREGAGTTTVLRYITSAWKNDNRGNSVFLTMCAEHDALRSLQHFANVILGESMPQDWRLYSACELVAATASHIQRLGISLLVLDRADRVPGKFVDYVMTVCSVCRERGHKVGILMGMREQLKSQLEFFEDLSVTNLAFQGRIPLLTAGEAVAVVADRCPHFEKLVARIANSEAQAQQVASHLHRLSGGTFRRIEMFANYVCNWPPGKDITVESLEILWNDAFGTGTGASFCLQSSGQSQFPRK